MDEARLRQIRDLHGTGISNGSAVDEAGACGVGQPGSVALRARSEDDRPFHTPCLEYRTLSRAPMSLTVPSMERGLDPVRSWSTTIVGVSPSKRSALGRALESMNP